MADNIAQMAEFAENLWNNFIKPKMAAEFRDNVTYYKATVVSNPGDGTLNVNRPYDNTVNVMCSDALQSLSAGDQVLVLVFGKGNAANHIAVSAANMRDITNYSVLPVSMGGTGSASASGARTALGINTTNLGISDYVIDEGSTSTGMDTTNLQAGVLYYRKWQNGTLEYWGWSRATNNAVITTSSWANGYESARFTLWGTWPIPFVSAHALDKPSVTYKMVEADAGYMGDYQFIESVYGINDSTLRDWKLYSPCFKFWRGSTATFGHPVFSFYAIGRWKV